MKKVQNVCRGSQRAANEVAAGTAKTRRFSGGYAIWRTDMSISLHKMLRSTAGQAHLVRACVWRLVLPGRYQWRYPSHLQRHRETNFSICCRRATIDVSSLTWK